MGSLKFPALGVALALAAGGCSPQAPQELTGLWARGEGGCGVGAGVRFEADAVVLVAGESEEVILRRPRYAVAAEGDRLRVTIRYALAQGLFGPRQGAELELVRRGDGWLEVAAHRTADGRRGFARLRTPEADPLYALFHARRCGEAAWIADLRGRPGSEQEDAAERGLGGGGAGTESGTGETVPQAVQIQLRGRAAELQDAS